MIKIIYIIPTLEISGGAERIIVEKANYLSNDLGYDIIIICLNQHDKDSNSYPLSEKVKQINLGISYHTHYKYKYPKRLWKKIQENLHLRKVLIRTIKEISPDILIGVSYLKADLISSIPIKAVKIFEFHEPAFLLYSEIYNGSLLSKLYAKFFYVRTIVKNADIIVTLTDEARKSLKKAKRVEVIPNFSSMPVHRFSDCTARRVIAVGRLNKEKGFDRLIEIWETISKKYPDWQLDIFGEGSEKENLLHIIETNNVKNISFRGSTKNISQEYSNSSICVVTSYYEGFSLVLLEAMRHGVPCVAYDCPYGPKNIIADGESGFLVKDGEKWHIIDKICNLMEDEQLRKRFSKASIEHAKRFDTDFIMSKWKKLFEEVAKRNPR